MEKRVRNRSETAREKARQFRANMSISEDQFWRAVRKDRLGFRFRRQVAVGPYFLDFYCPEASLAVEIDGPHHLDRKAKDEQRDQYLDSVGITTYRITSSILWEENEAVWTSELDKVQKLCEQRTGRPAFLT